MIARALKAVLPHAAGSGSLAIVHHAGGTLLASDRQSLAMAKTGLDGTWTLATRDARRFAKHPLDDVRLAGGRITGTYSGGRVHATPGQGDLPLLLDLAKLWRPGPGGSVAGPLCIIPAIFERIGPRHLPNEWAHIDMWTGDGLELHFAHGGWLRGILMQR